MAYTTISSHLYGGVWPTNYGSSGTLGIYCSENFVADDGKSFIAGTGESLTAEFVTKPAITVLAGVATVASFSLPKTDAGNPTTVRYYGRIYDANGTARDDYEFENFHLRTSLGNSITYQSWQLDNKTPITPQPDGAPTVTQMNLAILAAINNAFLPLAHGTENLTAATTTTVACAVVTANSAVDLMPASGTITGLLYKTNVVVGVSFDVVSTNGTDSGTFRWELY